MATNGSGNGNYSNGYSVVGTRPIRHDGVDKVTGNARFSADVNLPGMLYGKVLRSPHSHAVIRSIDTSRAEAYPGVRAVMTANDLPQLSGLVEDLVEGSLHNFRFLSNNVMALDKALYKGHAIAAVAATSAAAAEQALDLIDVDYGVLPAVTDAREALKPGAPILHPRLMTMETAYVRAGGYRAEGEDGQETNLANRFEFSMGDLEQGFAEADAIVEREVHTSPVHQGYIEPHAATAHWGPDGKLTIWSSSQGQFMVREQTSRLLNIPISTVKAIPMEIGGGFGGKLLVYLEPVAAILSRKAGHPVKLQMNRTEVLEATGPTAGAHIRVKMGATRDGKITAAEGHLVYEAGAFPGSPVSGGCQCMFSPYVIPNGYIEGIDVVVNRPKSAAYRAPGVPAAAFAVETVVDELCEKIGMDPLQFRLINAAREGERRLTGPAFGSVGMAETVEAVQAHDHYRSTLDGKWRGRGVAAGFWGNGTGPSTAIAAVNPDGTVSLVEGSPDIGGTRASAAMHLAEQLGIPAEDVKPTVADTDSIGYTSNTGGSSVTFKTGWACYTAAEDIKQQMIARAAKMWDVSEDDVVYEGGIVKHRSDSALTRSFKEMAAQLNATGGPITGKASVNPRGQGATFAVHVVDVEVDPETGKVEVLRYTAAQDVGQPIHPSYVEGQIQGGVVQGIGWALNEEYYLDAEGRMVNSSFLDYRMPIALDVPLVETLLVTVPSPGHPYGARGVGEVPIVPPPAAVANAIYHATGVRMMDLPMSPVKVQKAIAESGAAVG
ncbi:MAG: xanthine dehydrogenase family protein molybdopterin-binding subunit [Chloroflexota bacterium]|nr:xanthine dehydrogenase family protein molybdopterin-binding subunit [Chloroflexota bacterium]MDE2969975.1 xanthine dehydrogenase family protein molybdopterin-binding subunit [Chloroflexota bacterium]